MIRVRLLLESPALHAGLLSLLGTDPEIEVVGEGVSQPVGAAGWSDADVVITTSASLAAEADDALPGSRSAVLVLGDRPLGLGRLLTLGRAAGILPVDATSDELCAAVHALAAGLVVGTAALMAGPEAEPDQPGLLTDREAEVLQLLSRGLANKQIAVELGISEHTAKFHVSSIYTKLNVTSRTQAVREGLRRGWITL